MKQYLLPFLTIMFTFLTVKTYPQADSSLFFQSHLTGGRTYIYQNESPDEDKSSKIINFNELSGSWWGFREKMNEHGFNFSLTYTADFLSGIVAGHKSEAYYLDNTNARMLIDLQKNMGLKDAIFLISFLGNYGGNPAEATGTAQGISNIESINDFKLYELRLEKRFFNGRLSLLTGLYDLNSEFDVRESSKLFINPSHGIGADFAQSGENGPSIFPHTSLAFRLKYALPESYYFQAAVFDGVPGNPSNPYGTHIILNERDGLLIAAEGGLQKGDFSQADNFLKLSGGIWYYNSTYDDLYDLDNDGNPLRKRGNFGIYASAETFLYSEEPDGDQGAAAFVRIGTADGDINQFSLYTAAGINFIGLIPGRDSDQLGIAAAGAHNSSKYRMMASASGFGVRKNEINLEVTYSAQLFPWLRLQPDFQLILNPAGRSDGRSIFSAGSRMEIVF